MLEELRVENLLLLEEAQLRLTPGLNVLTGETGAGKTLLAHALDLLLGGRARKGIVRGGAAEAYVEGTFSLPSEMAGGELLPTDCEEIVLARRVWPDGRTRAYVCGRSATVGDLRELGSRLLAFYGQHEHRKLMLGAAQLEILDAHCGPEQLEHRRATVMAYEQVRGLRARVEELRELAGARDRELDLLGFELREIEAAAPSEGEKTALMTERDRLRHMESLRSSAGAAVQAIAGEEPAVAERLGQASRTLEAVAGVDAGLRPLVGRLDAARHEIDDISGELHTYLARLAGGIEEGVPPETRLQEIEERLALIDRLERKHGGTVADVLAHGERCRRRISELEQAEVALDGAEHELAVATAALARLSEALGARRREAAPKLAAAVRDRLGELAMPDARFEVVISERPDGPGPSGADSIELMIATNPGIALGPLREIASGGELSRVMLALLSVAHATDMGPATDMNDAEGAARDRPLLVFDEIDAGVGGHTAHAVGEHLRALAAGRQVLCITHLPQVAALAARHFTIAKDMSCVPARTTVAALAAGSVVSELVRMLGAGDGDRAAKQHARDLLRAAA